MGTKDVKRNIQPLSMSKTVTEENTTAAILNIKHYHRLGKPSEITSKFFLHDHRLVKKISRRDIMRHIASTHVDCVRDDHMQQRNDVTNSL